MDYLWIMAAASAALFQALRYASLKELNKHLTVMVTSYTRVLFALPLLLAHLAVVVHVSGKPLPAMSAWFVFLAGLGAIGQFLGTVLMVRLFQIGNFAVGTMLAKADAVMTAIIGSLLFSEVISGAGWVAILVTVAGVMLVSIGRLPRGALRNSATSLSGLLLGRATRIGLLIALVNAVSYLLLREAILSLKSPGGPMVDAAIAGTVMTALSVAFLTVWLAVRERTAMRRIGQHLRLGCFIGLASALGTALWFIATALTNASYVAAVAQVQIVFALAISHYWFREQVLPLELAGIATILAGVLLFKLV